MITSVEIYGHPYAAETYNLLSTDDIADIFNSVRNIDLAIKYIDGIFAIHLVYHNGKNVWITDPFGEYPIFVNEKDANIIVNFKPGIKYDKNDVYRMLATKNSDKGYHSNIVAGSSHIPMVTPWRNWNVAEPCSIYTIKNREISHRKYQLYRYETKETYVDIFASIIKNMAENRKVLLPLSAGYDSRGIYGVIKGSGIAYSRYTYGNEKQFVNRMDNSESCMPEFDGDYNSQVSKHILSMNGMGDIYFKCHNFYIQDYERRKDSLSKKEQDTLKDMRIVQEMYARGFTFVPIDIYRAKATRFQIVDGKLMPPLSSIEGMSDKAAEAVEAASGQGPYLSRDDFRQRTKVSKTVIDLMNDLGLFGDLPESNQLSLFDAM